MATTAREKLDAKIAAKSTPVLVTSLRTLEAGAKDEAERLVTALICDELERRHPDATDAIDAWLEACDPADTRTYGLVLIDALPAGAL